VSLTQLPRVRRTKLELGGSGKSGDLGSQRERNMMCSVVMSWNGSILFQFRKFELEKMVWGS